MAQENNTATQARPEAEQIAAPAPTVAEATPAKKRSPLLFIVIALVIVAGLYGFNIYSFNQTHASTDDSQVAATTVEVSPQISGTVEKVLIADNQLVKKGDLLLQIDPRNYQAAVDQAQANLDAALATAKGAGVTVNLTQQTGAAQVSQAQGVVGQAQSGISSAISDVSKADAGIASAQAGQTTASATIEASRSAVANARAARDKARAALVSSQAVVDSARAQVNAAVAQVATAQANYDLAQKDADRYANLVKDGAVSQQEADSHAAQAQTSAANLEAAKQQADAAKANLAQKQADVAASQQGIVAAEAGIRQAQAQVLVSQSQRKASDAGYRESLAERKAAEDAVASAKARAAQAIGQLAQAQTGGTQVSVSEAAKLQAMAKVEQARAALAEANLQLSYTKIYAPSDGRITKKNIDVGQLVQPGAPLFTLVEENDIWVVANLKETQLPGVTVGKKAEIEVDGVPGVKYTGSVESIQAGTGSTFTLLPPDNASGNFTKVVQRIPVKIKFDEGQKDLDRLRAGMSTTATINLK